MGRTVLVIDDEPHIRAVVREAVEDDGALVVEAGSAHEALAQLHLRHIDAVVLDIGLPDDSDLKLCAQVRALSDVPILVLSARHTDVEKAQLLDQGADDYLTKPFSTLELRARLRAQFRRSHRASSVEQILPVHIGSLDVDLTGRVAIRDGANVHLTRTEWLVLEALVQNANRTLTHSQLFSLVWGREFGEPQKYLRVFIAQLRRKIERDPLRPAVIITEPGIGYRLVLDRDSDT